MNFMKLCSTNELGNEIEDENIHIVNQMQEDIYPEVYQNFKIDNLTECDDCLNEENDLYFQKPQEKLNVFPEEKNQFSIFNPCNKIYNYDKLYSKDLIFTVQYRLDEKTQNGKETEKETEEEKGKETEKIMIEEVKVMESVMSKEEISYLEKESSLEEEKEFINENIKRKKNKNKKRDDLKRKRIKSDLCNHIITYLNQRLKSEIIFHQFKNIAQCEVIDVTKTENNKIFKFTLKELLSYKAFENIPYTKLKNKKKEIKREIERERVKKDWEYNKDILKCLECEKNKIIDNILNKKMKDIYKEYLASDEFQQSIEELKGEGKYYDYIHDYLIIAKNFLKYYEIEK